MCICISVYVCVCVYECVYVYVYGKLNPKPGVQCSRLVNFTFDGNEEMKYPPREVSPPEFQIPNPKSRIPNAESQILRPDPQIPDSDSWVLKSESWIQIPGSWHLDPEARSSDPESRNPSHEKLIDAWIHVLGFGIGFQATGILIDCTMWCLADKKSNHVLRGAVRQTLNSKPQTPNPKPQIPNHTRDRCKRRERRWCLVL